MLSHFNRQILSYRDHYMCETWVAAHPTLKIAAKTQYEIVSTVTEEVPRIVQGMQPPKTEENETATKTDPAPCHILKCPNLSIYQVKEKNKLKDSKEKVKPY